jgi:hypothetical protein
MYSPETLATLGTQDTGHTVGVMCLVYPMLPMSLDCTFLIASLVFSNV